MIPTHSKIAYIVVVGQVLIALILVLAICFSLFYKSYADPSILSAVIVLAGTIVGNLGSLLGGPRAMPQTTDAAGNTPVTIQNPPEKPVPVTEQPKP